MKIIPQILVIALYAFAFGIDLVRHGQPKTGKYDIWNSIIGITITFTLLTWGGFFNTILGW